jgi:hypothetical protein
MQLSQVMKKPTLLKCNLAWMQVFGWLKRFNSLSEVGSSRAKLAGKPAVPPAFPDVNE